MPASATPNTVTTLNGLFKVVYADKLLDLVPDFAILQKIVEFVPADKETGNYYAQPVNLAQEGGFTYLGQSGGVSALNVAVAGTMKEAQVKGTELNLRAQLSYGALARASKQGEKAFKRASSWKIEDMNNSTRKRLEISMLYGQSGIGTVSSVAGGGANVTLTAASWAGGIWTGVENHFLDFYASDNSTAHAIQCAVTSVTPSTLTINIGAAQSSGNINTIAQNDLVYFYGANAGSSTFNEMAGLQAIIQNSGTLFNINAGSFALWAGNNITGVGQLSFGKIQDAVSRAVNRGLMEKALVLCSPKAWAVLNSDQAALRMFDDGYTKKEFENGAEALLFHGPNGVIEVRAHPFVKDGDTFILPVESMMRIGSVDLTFGVPGFDQEFFVLVAGNNAVEIQCMADQSVFIEKPAHAVFMTGITYS